jgi:hypothetical protein
MGVAFGRGVAEPARIDESVASFIREHVRSVTELEVLLFLVNNAPRAFSAVEIARELRIAVDWAEGQLAKLSNSGILIEGVDGRRTFRYGAGSPAMNATMTRLARSYAQQRLGIIALIYGISDKSRRP